MLHILHFFISNLYYGLLNNNFNFIQLYILNIRSEIDMSRFNYTNEELKLPPTMFMSQTIKELNPSLAIICLKLTSS